jgi:uncharacterized membrane protein YhaH (DUF805 family)
MITDPLSAAKAGRMSPIDWALRPLENYAAFSGRAPRAEYWWYCLAATVFSIVVTIVDRLLPGPVYGDLGPLGLITTLALVIPGAAVTVRRLHDLDRSGWWFLLSLWSHFFLLDISAQAVAKAAFERLPYGLGFVLILAVIAGVVTLFVFMITAGTEGTNRFGPDPYGPDSLEEVFA